MKDKKSLRKEYKQKRNEISSENLSQLSSRVIKRLIETSYYKNCSSIFTYINTNSELITKELIKTAWKDNKNVAVPVITQKPHEMLFIKIENFNSLEVNMYGIYEPKIKDENILISDKNTLLIVPGLVFDKNKYRLGYGGGYYDKFISDNKTLKNIGVCFKSQIIDIIPKDKFDMQLDVVIYENGIIE